MPAANDGQVNVLVRTLPRRAHPGREPRARWISRSESRAGIGLVERSRRRAGTLDDTTHRARCAGRAPHRILERALTAPRFPRPTRARPARADRRRLAAHAPL